MGSTTPTPPATARSRSSTVAGHFGAARHQADAAGAHHVGVDGHADLELAQLHLAAHDQAASRRPMALTMACVMSGRQAGRRLVDQLRGLFGDASLRHVRGRTAPRPRGWRRRSSPAPRWPDRRRRVRATGTCIWPATMPATASRRGIVPSSLPAISRMRFVQAALFVAERLAAEGARQRFLRQRDAAELRDHRGQVVLPHVGQRA